MMFLLVATNVLVFPIATIQFIPRNATNIFINKLAQLNSSAPEYAEVDGIKGLPGILPNNRPTSNHQPGPYATTTLIEPTQSIVTSGHHSNSVSFHS